MPGDSPETPNRATPARRERILTAAGRLIVRQGFRKTSMSQVATAARVAKGTAYSYWPSKEALFVDLIADSFRSVLVGTVTAVTANPAAALPGPLLLTLLNAAYSQGLIRALQDRDEQILGDLLDNDRAAYLLEHHSALALLDDLLPIWRTHSAADRTSPKADQLGELELVALGYFSAMGHPIGGHSGKNLEPIFQRAVAHVLGTHADGTRALTPSELEGLAEATRAALERHIDALAPAAHG